MAGEWVVASLGDLVEIKHGYAFRGEFFRDEPIGDILLTPGNFAIGGGFRDNKFKYYDGPVPNDFVLKEGDLIVTMTDLSKNADTLGFAACVPARVEGRHFLHNQRLGKVTITNEQAADLGFIEYLMRSTEYRHEIVASATGTTVKHTSPERIKRFRFLLPPLPEQRAIASILGALDDKIELNRRMNRTLEAMARALFQSWFVDFDPVRAKLAGQAPAGLKPEIAALFPDRLVEVDGRKVPEGWVVASIYDVADVIYGAPYASKQFNNNGSGIQLIRIRDLRGENPSVWTEEIHPKGYLVRPGDIVVGMDGEFRAHLWGGANAWLNQRMCVFVPKNGHSAPYVRNSISKPLAEIEATETATTVIHLGKSDIDHFSITVPDAGVKNLFTKYSQPMYDRIVLNKQESRTLAALRDTLLPRLISGALRVADAERIVERCV